MTEAYGRHKKVNFEKEKDGNNGMKRSKRSAVYYGQYKQREEEKKKGETRNTRGIER